MESPIDAMYKAMLTILNNTAAIAGPIPVINVPVAAPNLNQKADKEAERRDQTNQRFAELQNLVAKDFIGKMSQANILKAAFEAVVKIKNESFPDPLQGLKDAIKRRPTMLKTLKKCWQCSGDAERQEELKEKIAMLKNLVVKDLDQKMCQLDILKATHKAALKIKNISASGPYCRGNQSSSTSEDTTSDSFAGAGGVDMKQIRRQREQNRRDCHSEGYSLLRQFIHENGLCDYISLHRTQILDVMISYISQANTVSLPDSPVDLKLYLDGFEHGKTVGKASVISFFETDPFLMNQSAAFQTFLELHLGTSSSSTPSSPSPIAPHVQFNPFLIYQLPLLYPDLFALPVLQIPSSTGSVASPSSLADASSASSSDRDSDSVPVSEEGEKPPGIFRPWQ
ncbi:unnamed protein product [Caenorhabditis brenneri]